MTGRRRLRMLLAGGAAAAVVVYAGAASAYWSAGGSGTGAASTDTLPAGGTPTATVAGGTTVTVSFGRAVTPAGHDVTSYAVRRYAAPTGGTATAAFTCSWPSAGALSCVETGVPAGVWYYTDTPLAGSSWVGTESARSNGAATDSTAPTIAVTSITPPPNGNGYHDSSPVTVNLAATDNAGGAGVASITYWVDAGTHTVIATTAAVSVAGDGAHSVSYFATDNAGNASATSTQTVRIDTVAPGVATVGSYPNRERRQPDGRRDSGRADRHRRSVQRWRRHVRLPKRGPDRGQRADQRQQDLHRDRHRRGREHLGRRHRVGERRRHRAEPGRRHPGQPHRRPRRQAGDRRHDRVHLLRGDGPGHPLRRLGMGHHARRHERGHHVQRQHGRQRHQPARLPDGDRSVRREPWHRDQPGRSSGHGEAGVVHLRRDGAVRGDRRAERRHRDPRRRHRGREWHRHRRQQHVTWAAASTSTDLATNPIGSTANTVDRTATPF
jgi:hypothetical protein